MKAHFLPLHLAMVPIRTAAGESAKVVSLLFAVTALMFSLYVIMAERALIVLPVSLPIAPEYNGYSPTAAAEAVAAHMADMVGVQGPEYAEELAIDGPPIALVVSSTIANMPDLQIPGQSLSIRAVSRFVRGVFGGGDPTVSIAVARSGDDHVIRAVTMAGPYAGRRTSATVPVGVPLETVMMTGGGSGCPGH